MLVNVSIAIAVEREQGKTMISLQKIVQYHVRGLGVVFFFWRGDNGDDPILIHFLR